MNSAPETVIVDSHHAASGHGPTDQELIVARPAPTMAKWRLIAHIARGVWQIPTRYRRADVIEKQRLIRVWSEQLLALCGVTLKVHLPDGVRVLEQGTMLVSNHVSWLDIYVINAWRPTPFVAKAEIARWPVIGFLATAIGTVFIQRERRGDAKRIVDQLSRVLKEGGLVCLFPEGTTSDGRTVLPFHANIFQAAVAAGAPVQPVTLLYERPHAGQRGEQSLAPAYIGDMSLGDTLKAVLRTGPIIAHLYVGQPLMDLADRRSAAQAAYTAIDEMLKTMQAPLNVP
ncbi:lysophospholipid acyltransferase family protein [Robbsia andropogonis]|nr:lysophospholipid acyltransferase family protein [Robbsia andropogonis]MCP1116602.1 1-acyl-sn-glycerol-3-phosphate acyltransferase [Robbsia andropogonis]MCP1126719.1 1-acyl-sn-glycerol-3-phosphate acyltransferase [Robbsia andropogonis]